MNRRWRGTPSATSSSGALVGSVLRFVIRGGGYRQHGEFSAPRRNRTVQRRAAGSAARPRLRSPERHRHHPARRPRGPQRHAEQPQKGQALALRNQVHAIEQRVAEPREQLDQASARIPGSRIGPFGRVRGDARDQFRHEVVVRTVVQTWWSERHGRNGCLKFEVHAKGLDLAGAAEAIPELDAQPARAAGQIVHADAGDLDPRLPAADRFAHAIVDAPARGDVGSPRNWRGLR